MGNQRVSTDLWLGSRNTPSEKRGEGRRIDGGGGRTVLWTPDTSDPRTSLGGSSAVRTVQPSRAVRAWPRAGALTWVWRHRCVSCSSPARPPPRSAPPVRNFGCLWSVSRKHREQHSGRSVRLRVWSQKSGIGCCGATPPLKPVEDPIRDPSGGGRRPHRSSAPRCFAPVLSAGQAVYLCHSIWVPVPLQSPVPP